MKKLVALLFTISFLITSHQVSATHVMGADITYTCDSAKAYTFKIVYYRYCGGVPFSNPSNLTKLINPLNGRSQGVALTRQSIQEVTPVCKTASGRCNPTNTSRTGEGIEAHVYTVSVDFDKTPYSNLLTSGGCEIRFETGQCCRNSNINTGAANQNFYTYAILNLCEAPVNNSPQFLYAPIGYLCCNQPSYSSVGGFDLTDFDSLSYAFAQPLRGFNNTISYSGKYTYTNPFQAYYPGTLKPPYSNPNANPPIGIYLDPANGSVIWTPTKCDEITVAILEITEWRKDTAGKYQKIGVTRRDMQYVTKLCPSNNPPTIPGTKKKVIKLAPCLDEYCFTINTADRVRVPPPPAKTPPSDSVTFVTPTLPYGVSFNIVNPKDTNPSAEICVDLTKVDLDKLTQHALTFPITIRDNACPLNAVSTYVYRIEFDTTNTFGKLAGTVINDRNTNCTQNTGESNLEYIRKVNLSKQGFYQYTENDGTFELCLDTGTTIAKLSANPWFDDQCVTDTITVLKDSTHEVEFFSKLKDGISGYVYTETSSCNIGKDSKPIKGQMLVANPGKHYTITDKNGFYLFNVSAGNYTVSLVNDTSIWKNRCTKTMSVSLSSGQTKQIDTFLNYHKNVTDLDVSIGFNSGTTVRKGTDCYANLVVTNNGRSTIDSAVITVETDNNLVTLAKSHFSWKSLGSGKYQTTVYNILPIVKKRLSLYLATKGYSTGDTIPFIVTSDSLSTVKDFDSTNNHDTAALRVVSPYDPNIKTALPDSIFTVDDRTLTYTVEFQNEGTASAIDVVLRDTLSEDFDLSSLQFHYASHDYTYLLEDDQLWIMFEDINLPTKSSDFAGSMGSVTFSIRLKDTINEEKIVNNRVGIYFDAEDVVLTNYQTNHFKSPTEFTDTIKSVYCLADTIKVPFISWFKPQSDNIFVLEMTDSSGSHASYLPIDSISTSDTFGTFEYVIPLHAVAGNNYQFRVVSSSIQTTMFEDNYSQNFKIESNQDTKVLSTDTLICNGTSVLIQPSENHFDNTCYLNGNAIFNGANGAYTTDSLSNGDYVYYEHKSKYGCKAKSDTMYFEVLSIPELTISSNDSIYCDSTTTVSFNYQLNHGDGFGASPNSLWDFGDNSTATIDTASKNVSHQFTKGTYTITATTTNGICSDSSSTDIYVGVQPNASISNISTDICPGQNFTAQTNLKDAGLGFSLDSTLWEFSDGSNYNTNNTIPTHSFATSGSYSFDVILFSGGCTDTATGALTVISAPKGTILTDTLKKCLPDNEFEFSANITGDYNSMKWQIEGQEYSSNTIKHVFNTVGNYTIDLIVLSGGQCNDTSQITVGVFDSETADFDISVEYCSNEVISIKSNGNAPTTTYKWLLFGTEYTGTSHTGIDLSDKPVGTNNISLTTTTSEGCKDSVSKSFEVIQTPVVSFDITNVCHPELVTLQNTSTNTSGNTNYLLEWGDGNERAFVSLTTESHLYQAAGDYKVKLVGKEKTCADSSEKTVSVYAKPVASFMMDEPKGTKVDFTNTSTENNRNYWTLGNDKFEDNEKTFRYDFKSSGIYNIELITESDNGCKDTVTDIVNIAGVIKFYIPNAFSPNNDGINDKFNISPDVFIQDINFTLYNRWGNLVTQSSDKNNLLKEDLPNGLYMFIIEITAVDGGKHYHSGTLNIW